MLLLLVVVVVLVIVIVVVVFYGIPDPYPNVGEKNHSAVHVQSATLPYHIRELF